MFCFFSFVGFCSHAGTRLCGQLVTAQFEGPQRALSFKMYDVEGLGALST